MQQATRDFINTHLTIGGRRVEKRLVLAPMSGLGHVAFREVLAAYGGCGLMFTGMCSAKSIPQENPRVSRVFCWREQELPRLVCQLFGSEAEAMAVAARRIEAEGFFGVDLNFGCSVARICKRNSGAALLKSPGRAVHIVEAVRRAVSFPVFVKFRTGWEDRPEPAVSLARRFEAAGADALTFHPRVAPDRRARPPRWEYIAAVREAVSVPVFGNGNVFSAADCEQMLVDTGCDGVALGRAAVAKPWIFAEWTSGGRFGRQAFAEMMEHFIDRLQAHYEPNTALRSFRKASVYMAAFFRFGHAFHKRLQNAAGFAEIRDVMREFTAGSPEMAARPNMNLF
ncbi:MAG: tRNA-dihydrouridine synthase family protein [Desulfosalsimonadaceae bacterium]